MSAPAAEPAGQRVVPAQLDLVVGGERITLRRDLFDGPPSMAAVHAMILDLADDMRAWGLDKMATDDLFSQITAGLGDLDPGGED